MIEWHTAVILMAALFSLGFHIGSYRAYRRGRKDGLHIGEVSERIKNMGIDIDA